MVKKVSIWLTLEPLIYSKEPKHLAEISKKLKKPHASVRRHLAVFENLGLVEKERKGRQTFYKLRETPLLTDYLTVVEKERLIEKCKKDFILKDIVEYFHKTCHNDVLIFGSAVESVGKANDVDVLIVGKFKREKLKSLEDKLNLKFHVINVRSLDEVGETLKKEIMNKHLIVQGSERLIKWLIS